MQLWQYCLLVTARLLYIFRTLSASIVTSTKNCISSHWCSAVATDLGHLYWIYRCPRRNVPDFGRVFLMLKYTDITQNTCPKLNGYGDNGQRKVWSSGGSTHCTCQLTALSMLCR